MLTALVETLKKLTGLDVIVEPTKVEPDRPHLKVVPKGVKLQREGNPVVFDPKDGEKTAITGIPYKALWSFELYLHLKGANVDNTLVGKVLEASTLLAERFSKPIKVETKEDVLAPYIVARPGAILQLRKVQDGKFYNLEDEKHRLFLYEEVWEGSLLFGVLRLWEVPKVQEISAKDKTSGEEVRVSKDG
jgi:hypothetical protein